MNLKPALKSYSPLPAVRARIVAWVGCTTSVSRRQRSSWAGRAADGPSTDCITPGFLGLCPAPGSSLNLFAMARSLPCLEHCSPPFPVPGEAEGPVPEGWACLTQGPQPKGGCRMPPQQGRRCARCGSHAWCFHSLPFLQQKCVLTETIGDFAS